MNFFEQELRKIVGDRSPDTTFVGRACYVRLNEMNRVKIRFISTEISNHYNALRLTILNRQEGEVDNLLLRFSDLLGKKMTSNPNFPSGITPHIWDDNGKLSWYVYQPSSQDYQTLSDATSDYLQIFQEMASLFDGIGGFPLAAVRCGVEPVWASEIEPFPILVTKLRFPQMTHMGDITKLNGADLPPVDIICGGSPCQDCLWPERVLV